MWITDSLSDGLVRPAFPRPPVGSVPSVYLLAGIGIIYRMVCYDTDKGDELKIRMISTG